MQDIDSNMARVIDFTLRSFQEPLRLSQIASIAVMSVSSFCYHFKKWTNRTYIDYLNEVRVNNARYLLIETTKSVSEIAYECGYNSKSQFHRQFSKKEKKTPLQYRIAHQYQ